MKTNEKINKIHGLAYHILIIVHTMIVIYMITIFVISTTNVMAKLPTLKNLNLFFFSGYVGTQLLNKFRCPLTEWQNKLAERLNKRRIKTFTGHLFEKIGIKISKTAIDIISAVIAVAIIFSYFVY
jgi:hypothetical protein